MLGHFVDCIKLQTISVVKQLHLEWHNTIIPDIIYEMTLVSKSISQKRPQLTKTIK